MFIFPVFGWNYRFNENYKKKLSLVKIVTEQVSTTLITKKKIVLLQYMGALLIDKAHKDNNYNHFNNISIRVLNFDLLEFSLPNHLNMHWNS